MAEPTRSCDVCRKRAPKQSLKRWVRQNGELVADPKQKLPGRGYYTDNPECETQLKEVIKRRK